MNLNEMKRKAKKLYSFRGLKSRRTPRAKSSIRKSAFAGRPVGSSYAHFPLFSTPSPWFRRATRLGRPPINGTRFLVLFAFIGAHIPWTAELLEKPIITKRAISPSMNCNCLLRTIFVSLNLRCVPKRDTYTTTKN